MALRPIPRAPGANVTESDTQWPPTEPSLRAKFDAAPSYTIGIEDEVMLLAPDTLELADSGTRVLSLLNGDPRFKLELPACQLEIVTPSTSSVADAARSLLEGRRSLAERSEGLVALACAGVHPFSSGIGQLNRLPRYQPTIREYGGVAERQLVCALQVHVSVGDADRALAVYNGARCFLPLIAALAANAPFYEGRDTGLASVRPKLGGLLPRQGIPPEIPSWEAYAEIMRWGAQAGVFRDAQTWWWELRLHPSFGTIEFRVPDSQTTVLEAAAIATVVQSLAAWLGRRHDSGERRPPAATWQIEENRWSACRYGVEGSMVELSTVTRRSTGSLLGELLDAIEPFARSFASEAFLNHARRMARFNGALAQRRVAADEGVRGVARWLAQRFLDPL
jgi:glutamate---cysteine ligase / carboxylate-amine ligase